MLDIATGPGYVAATGGRSRRGLRRPRLLRDDARLCARPLAERRVRSLATQPSCRSRTASFDAVTCAFLLLHLGRPEAVVAEAARVLAPDGRAAFSVWDEPSRSRWLGVVLDAVTAAGAQPPADVPPGPPMFRFADDGEFGRLLTRGGARGRDRRSRRVPARARKWRRAVDRTRRRQRARAAARSLDSRRRCSARSARTSTSWSRSTGPERGSRCRSLSSSLRGESRPSPKCRSRRAASRPASTRASRAGAGRS